MRFSILFCGVFLLAAAYLLPGAAGARELGAHEHGHGRLNIALEGETLWIELMAPGADIVGFEHPARSDGDKAAVAAAEGKLSDPLAIFSLPDAAGCVPQDVSVQVVTEGEAAHHEAEDDDGHEAEPAGHSEFHAEYRLVCAQPDEIRRIGFPYFAIFAGARELDVTLLSDRGQSRFEVTAAAPSIELGP